MGEIIPMLAKMAPILGPEVTSMFQLMAQSEEVIAEEIEADPLNAAVINGAFCLLCPRMTLFGGKNPRLYRHHCREIIAREVAGEDTRPGTKAEVLATLSQTSMVAELIESAHVLMDRLTKEVFPEYQQPDGWTPQESWPGAVEETLAKCRASSYDDKRTREQKRRS